MPSARLLLQTYRVFSSRESSRVSVYARYFLAFRYYSVLSVLICFRYQLVGCPDPM